MRSCRHVFKIRRKKKEAMLRVAFFKRLHSWSWFQKFCFQAPKTPLSWKGRTEQRQKPCLMQKNRNKTWIYWNVQSSTMTETPPTFTVWTFIQVYHSSLFEKYSKCFISNITYTNVTIANRCVKIHKQIWQSYGKSRLNLLWKIGKNKVIQDRTNPFPLHTGLSRFNYQTKIGC